ncbi:hypothetical protein PENTCL1PPCAC_19248, partial [Pristionchus entomophagus]
DFMTYGESGDLQLMDRLFRLGCQFRGAASRHADTKDVGDIRIDESIVLKTINDQTLGPLSACRPLTDCIYGRYCAADAYADDVPVRLRGRDATTMQLNEQQTRAVRAYADTYGPRVFVIRSPPGSGKTTVAAAMVAAVSARGSSYGIFRGGVQLLLSVQNVAVD